MKPLKLNLKKGQLHKDLGIKKNKKIPTSTLQHTLAHTSDTTEKKRLQFALNARHWKHK